MAEASVFTDDPVGVDGDRQQLPVGIESSVSFPSTLRNLWGRRRLIAWVLGIALLAWLAYCLFLPRQYEAKALLALQNGPTSPLRLDGAGEKFSGSFASGQVQLETLAQGFRADQLAWRVIVAQRLDREPGFRGGLERRFPNFHLQSSSAEARDYLLRRFRERLTVRTIPRTLVLEIRFRSGDSALSAAVVNTLIDQYQLQVNGERVLSASKLAKTLDRELTDLKRTSQAADERVADFQAQHRLVAGADATDKFLPVGAQQALDELQRQQADAIADRIRREAAYRAAMNEDPELVAQTNGDGDSASGAALRQIRFRRSELEQELAQLNVEYGPNYPRVLEIRDQLRDLDAQVRKEDTRIQDRLRSEWQLAKDREQMLGKQLQQEIGEGLAASSAEIQYEAMRREAEAQHDLYVQLKGRLAETELDAGAYGSEFRILDPAHPVARPSRPNVLLALAIIIFAGIWLSVGSAFAADMIQRNRSETLVLVALLLVSGLSAAAQAPTPSTSGLPTGVARIPAGQQRQVAPDAREAPPVWGGAEASPSSPLNSGGADPVSIGPGDLIDVSEYHTPQFHSSVRVSAAGTVVLPMVGEVKVSGMDESSAAHAIGDALLAGGILRHPQVNVLVTASAGRDVSILGEVVRPGVYPLGVHRRLFDLISAAQGLSPSAGTAATIYHREDGAVPEQVVLVPATNGAGGLNNPELHPGDTVRISRGGLVYVVGDVIRPGGFDFDPAHAMTVLQAVSLAWGPAQNASLKHALLLHEQGGNRVVTQIDLKKMLRGQDPDVPLAERDILYVPDSAAKNLWNRTVESVVQSAAGVSIYSGLVYSQRY